jgi:hypothetical protein
LSQSNPSQNESLLMKEISLIFSKNLAAEQGDEARAAIYAAKIDDLRNEISFRMGQSIARMAELTADPAMQNPQTYADYSKSVEIAVDQLSQTVKVGMVKPKCGHESKHTLSSTSWRCLLCGVEGGIVVSPDGQGYEYEEKVAKPKPPLGKIRNREVEDLDPPRSLRVVS